MLSPSDVGAILVGSHAITAGQWQRVARVVAGGADLDAVLAALAAAPPWWWDGPGPAPPGLTDYQKAVVVDRAEADDAAGLRAGVALNQFVLLGPLGEGGQGRVFLARQLRPARFAAVKVLTRDTEPRRRRFEQEAKAMMQLAHPAVARFYQYERVRDEAGRPSNDYLIAMEYVEGTDLYRLVRRTGVAPWRFAARWAAQLLAGLDYLHARGFVHRDVKPENVMAVGPVAGWDDPAATAVKLLDLGAVKPTDGEDAARAAGGKTFVGTPEYAPPEQWAGQIVPASDLYAVGGTLFFLLTDRSPYQKQRRDPFAYMASHTADPVPDLRKINPDVPARLNAVFQRLMAKEPADRGTAKEAIAELDKLLADSEVARRPAAPPAPVRRSASALPPNPPARPAAARATERAGPAVGPIDTVLAALERVFVPARRRPRPEDRLTVHERVFTLLRRPLVILLLVIAGGLLARCLW